MTALSSRSLEICWEKWEITCYIWTPISSEGRNKIINFLSSTNNITFTFWFYQTSIFTFKIICFTKFWPYCGQVVFLLQFFFRFQCHFHFSHFPSKIFFTFTFQCKQNQLSLSTRYFPQDGTMFWPYCVQVVFHFWYNFHSSIC